jgi:precorrin-8X/cobalt-precorrin-8 methylmutase
MDFIKNPRAIEDKSMDIIDELLGPVDFTTEELAIIKRIVHTTGDPNYASLVKIHPEAIERGIEALKGGASIFTDVKMIQAGINSRVLGEFGGEVYCDISSPAISEEAKRTGLTRALTAFRSWGKKIDGSIVAIGNAPTALFEVLRLAEEENIRPALVVGIPVGFVGAAESKEALVNSDLPYITIPGTKGGSTITVATLNALFYLARGARWD